MGLHMDIQGRYGKARIFTHNIESKALSQVLNLLNQPYTKDCQIRVMPDVHAGAGCVIGFTACFKEIAVPNLVGVDIGCGMLTCVLGDIDIDLDKLDEIIRRKVPSGYSTHDHIVREFKGIEKLNCYHDLQNISRIERSIETLGGGNHFIEVSQGSNRKFLIIHSGSRNLGKQVAEHYQRIASKGDPYDYEAEKRMINLCKSHGESKEIGETIKTLRLEYSQRESIPKELAYIKGLDYDRYMQDMAICQTYATLNREVMAESILEAMGTKHIDMFHTVHNYIDSMGIVRKGAVSANLGERILIPINMRDGSLLCYGKGNPDWNFSAPHGAGRVMSRSSAKKNIALEDFQKEMQGIYTTSVSESTIDEAPMAYKDMEEIKSAIGDTAEIIDTLKPIYNYKAGGNE
jgi:RNA-splicing ligase RtcB